MRCTAQIDGKATGRWLAREITEGLRSMQYGMAYTMIRGIEDFLAGPEVLRDGGAAALAAIRAERKEYAETVVHPAVKIGELTGARPADPSARPSAPQGESQPRSRQTRGCTSGSGAPSPGRSPLRQKTISGGTCRCSTTPW